MSSIHLSCVNVIILHISTSKIFMVQTVNENFPRRHMVPSRQVLRIGLPDP